MRLCPAARGDAIPRCIHTWRVLATRPLHIHLSRRRTPDVWVHDGQSCPDAWARLPFAPLVPASLRSFNGMPATARPVPPPSPGLEHVGYDIGVPPPLALGSAWSVDSPPSALVTSGPCGVASPVYPQGSGVPKSCAPRGWIFLPLCQ